MFGLNLNLTAALSIIEEEATTIGILAEDHLSECYSENKTMRSLYKLFYDEAFMEFAGKVESLYIESVDEVMDTLKNQTPKTHAAFVGYGLEFEKLAGDFDNDTIVFLESMRKLALKTLVKYTDVKTDMFFPLILCAKSLKTATDEYSALSTTSKNNLERETCFRTTWRIMEMQGEIKKMRNTINLIIDIQKMFESWEVLNDYDEPN